MAFDYATNFSNGSNVDTLGSLVEYGNYVTEGWLAATFVIIVGVMSFMLGSTRDANKGFLFSGFVVFIFSSYFMRLGLINPVFVVIGLFMIIVGLFATKSDGGF